MRSASAARGARRLDLYVGEFGNTTDVQSENLPHSADLQDTDRAEPAELRGAFGAATHRHPVSPTASHRR